MTFVICIQTLCQIQCYVVVLVICPLSGSCPVSHVFGMGPSSFVFELGVIDSYSWRYPDFGENVLG